MDARPPVTVFFGRAGYAPSQPVVDLGRAGMATSATALGVLTASFTALQALPVLRDGAGSLFHIKGVAASLIFAFPSGWKTEWLEHVQSLDGAVRLALGGRMALAAGLALGAAFLVWRRTAAPTDGYLHVRGRQLLEGKAALDAARAVAKAEIGGQPEREDIRIHPAVRLSTDRVSRHGIVFGKVGGGKTTIIIKVLAEILERRHKALIFDIKGDYTSKFWRKGGPVAILAPWDRRSMIWDIAKDCRTRQDAARFASHLIRESKDPMWSAAARQLLVGFLVHLQMTRGESWGWKDIADLLATPEKELLALMSEANPEAIRAVEQTGTTTTGILINLSAFLSVIYDLAEAWPVRIKGRMFSVREWIFDDKSARRAVILGGNKEFGPLMSSFAGALVAQTAAYVCSPRLTDSRTRRLYFVFDEFPQLGKVDIEPLVAVGRSKGARVWLGLQDFGQLKKLYGADEAQAIAAMVGTLICAGAAPGETAKFIADMAGTREVERNSLSISVQGGMTAASTSQSWQRETIPVLTESQASGLGPVPGTREIRALLLNFGDDALVLRWPFDTRPSIAEPVELAEWTLPTAEKRERDQERADLAAILYRKQGLTPADFDPAGAEAWLRAQTESGDEPTQPADLPAEPDPAYTVDAPGPVASPSSPRAEESDEDPSIERLLDGAGESMDAVEVADMGSAILRLAKLADALRQKPGPTREQAPPPRRTR
jgi:type IV secretory pathway TraG/TraD family ATPase VirD4